MLGRLTGRDRSYQDSVESQSVAFLFAPPEIVPTAGQDADRGQEVNDAGTTQKKPCQGPDPLHQQQDICCPSSVTNVLSLHLPLVRARNTSLRFPPSKG